MPQLTVAAGAEKLTHVYREPGIYTIVLSARGVTGDSALLKVRVRVEADKPEPIP